MKYTLLLIALTTFCSLQTVAQKPSKEATWQWLLNKGNELLSNYENDTDCYHAPERTMGKPPKDSTTKYYSPEFEFLKLGEKLVFIEKRRTYKLGEYTAIDYTSIVTYEVPLNSIILDKTKLFEEDSKYECSQMYGLTFRLNHDIRYTRSYDYHTFIAAENLLKRRDRQGEISSFDVIHFDKESLERIRKAILNLAEQYGAKKDQYNENDF